MNLSLYIRPGESFQGMLELAEFADQNKYYGVFINDHIQSFAKKGNDPYLEAWTAMTGIGVLTKRVRIGQIVLFNSLRNPAYLAKSIATLDNMIDGRYECMIGAGWNDVEYTSYDLMENGRGMPSAKERVDRFKEALIIIKGMLKNSDFSYNGNFWKVRNAKNVPQPIQNNMRISVGAKRPRMLKITAKYADGLNVASSGLEDITEVIETTNKELTKSNINTKDFYYSGFYSIYLAKNQDHYDILLKDISKNSNKPQEWVKKNIVVGTRDIVIDKLRHLEKLGMKMAIVVPRNGTQELSFNNVKENLELLTDEIIPNI